MRHGKFRPLVEIEPGDCVVYPFADRHALSSIYTNVSKARRRFGRRFVTLLFREIGCALVVRAE